MQLAAEATTERPVAIASWGPPGLLATIRILMAARHVSIEASGFLSALARHLMLTRHARANAK
jgi:hypothetical protein